MGSKKVLNNYGSFDVVFKSGKGSILTDINGKKYKQRLYNRTFT